MAKVKATQTISNKRKYIGVLTVFVVAILITAKVMRDYEGSSIPGGPSQSPWDNSVDCVVSYLKYHYLRDPDSYESINWSEIAKNSDGTYQVTHTFRAKNGFGGMGVETLTFTIAPDGQTIINSTRQP
jgi:hypothetical protein